MSLPKEVDEEKALSYVENVLRKATHLLPSGTTFRPQRRSIGIKIPTTRFTFDVVPAILTPDKDSYLILDRKLQALVRTYPQAAIESAKVANEADGQKLMSLIRLVKHWNQSLALKIGLSDENGDIIKPFMIQELPPRGYVL